MFGMILPNSKMRRLPTPNSSATCENRIYFSVLIVKKILKTNNYYLRVPTMGTLIYFIFAIFAPCDTDLEPYYLL